MNIEILVLNLLNFYFSFRRFATVSSPARTAIPNPASPVLDSVEPVFGRLRSNLIFLFGSLESGKIPGYEFVRTVVDENGNVRHIFRKVTKPAASVELKAQPKRLANTGTTETNTGLAGLGLAILGLAGIARRRKEKQ